MNDVSSYSHYVSKPKDRGQLHFVFSRAQIREYVFPELANKILKTTPFESIYGMNVDPGVATLSAAEWLNLKSNDRILLFENNKLRSCLVCTGKFQSDGFANSLNLLEDQTFSPFFYTFVTEFEFPRTRGLSNVENFMALYSDVNIPFARIEPNVERNLWDSINTIFEFTFTEPEDANLRNLSVLESLDVNYLAKFRVEQKLLRKQLLHGRRIGECFFCRKIFQAEYLVAAHIKQRSECTLEERLDYDNNVVLACRFGCDFLFELGKFTVLDSGVIKTYVSDLDQVAYEYLRQNLGSNLVIKDEMKKYFSWHYENKFNSNF